MDYNPAGERYIVGNSWNVVEGMHYLECYWLIKSTRLMDHSISSLIFESDLGYAKFDILTLANFRTFINEQLLGSWPW